MGREELPQTALLCAGSIVSIGTALGILCVWQRATSLGTSLLALSESVHAQGRVLRQLAIEIRETSAEAKAEEDASALCGGRDSWKYEDSFSGSGQRGYYDSYDSLYGSGYTDRRRLQGSRGLRSYYDRDSLGAYDRRSSLDAYDYDDYDYGSYDYERSSSSYDSYSSGGYGGYYGGYGAMREDTQKGLQRQFKNRTRALERILWQPQPLEGVGAGSTSSQNGSTAMQQKRLDHRGVDDALGDASTKTLADAIARGCRWAIPPVLHQTWKTAEVPSKFFDHLASWRRLHRHWRFEFWDDARCRRFVAEHFPKYLREYDRMSGIKRADVIRIIVLYVQGGVYADIDVEAVSPLGPLLAAALAVRAGVLLGEENFVHSVLLEHKSTWLVSNAVMASAPGHPFWLDALREIFSNTWCGDDPVQCTGPRLIDRLSWEYLRRKPDCGTHGCIVRLPYTYFSPDIARWNAQNMKKECRLQGGETYYYSKRKTQTRLVLRACRSLEQTLAYPAALRTKRTYAVHHWQCSWCREDESLRGTVQMNEVIWKVGNETVQLVSQRRRRRRKPSEPR